MKKILIIMMITLLSSMSLYAGNVFKGKIIDGESGEVLAGATAQIEGTVNAAIANADGEVVIENISDGNHTIIFSCIGYETEEKTFSFPLDDPDKLIIISLEEDENELEEVIITATRSTRSFKDSPTRVEFIGSEELEEKNLMKPGDIRMLLSESTGIQTQQTSAISGNSLIKIQGLDGKYTQILKDGFPVFSGVASGLGLLQTPPLDLRQVEIIKGSSSTLYGGGAIAGLVNLVSKIPQQKRDFQLQLNGTSAKGLDVNAFYGQRFNKVGTTVFASYNRNWAYAPSDVEFTAIPQFDRITFNPTFFCYPSSSTSFNFGIESMIEDRLGGDIAYIKHGRTSQHTYFEHNKSQRYSTRFSLQHDFNESRSLSVKNSVTLFRRKIEIPTYRFDGDQWSSFTEVSYRSTLDKTEWVGGLNVWTEHFDEHKVSTIDPRDFSINTFGAFIQNTTNIGEKFVLESGLRGDYIHDYGFAVLPRLSALFKINSKFSTRIGGGFGYKPPSIFSEESERLQFANVLPINKEFNKLERSYGANVDFNYRTGLADDKIFFSVNQLFFYTYLRNPLELKRETNGLYRFYNIDGNVNSKGSETNVKVTYSDFSLFLGYTYTDARIHDDGITRHKTLTPKHRLNSMIMYEIEDSWRIGYELYYVGKQTLTDGLVGKDYVTMGFMIQKIWEKISIYANFENFTDRKQTRFDTIYTGSITNPEFRDIYAPLDGFVANAGIIFKF